MQSHSPLVSRSSDAERQREVGGRGRVGGSGHLAGARRGCDSMSVAAPWPRTRSRSSLLSSAEQGARTVMGLSVAVVLGFNIGGGNLRSRIGAGDTHTSFIALLTLL